MVYGVQKKDIKEACENVLNRPEEVVRLAADQCLHDASEHCVRIQPGNPTYPDAADLVRRFNANPSEELAQALHLQGCYRYKGGSQDCEGWYKIKKLPAFDRYLGTHATINRTKPLVNSGILQSQPRPSITKLITDSATQVVTEVLHMVLNTVRCLCLTLSLLASKYVSNVLDQQGMPQLKTAVEVSKWVSPQKDNSKEASLWKAQGYYMQTVLDGLLGYKRPLRGYAGNECRDILERVDEICNLPVMACLDQVLGSPGTIRKLLTATAKTMLECYSTKPCCVVLKESIPEWVAVLRHPKMLEVSDPKTYDHLAAAHVVDQILRFGNLIQFATFGTEHDNSLVRATMQRHTMRGGGAGGFVGEMRQATERLMVLRCSERASKATFLWASGNKREVEVGAGMQGRCNCQQCCQMRAARVGLISTQHQ